MKAAVVKNVATLCREAWAGLWADNLRQREEGRDFRGSSYYITATDMERAIRRRVEALARGDRTVDWKEWRWGTYSSVRISVPGYRGGLFEAVRDWLLSNPDLEEFNFGRGHISGARFRPIGSGKSPVEQKTVEKQAKEKPWNERVVHARMPHGGYPCVFKPGRHSWRFRRTGKSSDKKAEITCKACLNLLANPLTPAERARCMDLSTKIERRRNHQQRQPNSVDLSKDKAFGGWLAEWKLLAKRQNAMRFGKKEEV